MPMTTTTTTTRTVAAPTTTVTGVAVHTISFKGLAGAILILLGVSMVLYVVGFASVSWSVKTVWPGPTMHYGLWDTCTCTGPRTEDWFKAVQAMITIGLISLLLAMILATIYLCVHSVSKNATILALVIVCFLAVVFMIIGFCVYGAYMDGLNWSFAITVIASILCFVAGVLSVMQLRQSGVRV